MLHITDIIDDKYDEELPINYTHIIHICSYTVVYIGYNTNVIKAPETSVTVSLSYFFFVCFESLGKVLTV